jgi:hypothetical protein
LRNNEVLSIYNYKWFGQNREHLHERARRGSGGIGCFIKETLLQQYDCKVLDSSFEGIFIIQLEHKVSRFKICLYIVYLPPERSVKGRDADTFFEHLLNCTYMYSQSDMSLVLGDLNGRIGNKDDFVDEVDDVLERKSIDDGANKHGDSLLQFCKDSKFVILNGRVTPEYDNFTCISTKGKSVVDYILCPQSDVTFCKMLQFIRVTNLLQKYNLTPPEIGTEGNLPDHSIVCAHVKVHYESDLTDHIVLNKRFRYNFRNIPASFMNNDTVANMVDNAMVGIDNCLHTQEQVDSIYQTVCNVYATEMNDKLLLSIPRNNKGVKRKPKPWWCDELSVLWKELCGARKSYVRESGNRALRRWLRGQFLMKQSEFDKVYRRIKRKYEKDFISNIGNCLM